MSRQVVASANAAAQRAVLSAYKIILRSLKRGCIGIPVTDRRDQGQVVDSVAAEIPETARKESVLLKLPNIIKGSVSDSWRQTVRDEFRLGSVISDSSSVRERNALLRDRRKLARDYADLLSEINTHEKLLMDFGWGDIRDSRSDLQNVARRCGLELDNNSPVHNGTLPLPVSPESEEETADDDEEMEAFGSTERDPLQKTLNRIDQYYKDRQA